MVIVYVSSINNKDVKTISDAAVDYDITHLSTNGPHLNIEGYASIEGLATYTEESIRKTLLFVPIMDLDLFREKNEEYIEMLDEEIIERHMVEYALDNCMLSELDNKVGVVQENTESLSGFQGVINLTTINNGKPLSSGEYDVYIKLEQLKPENDTIKYEKIISLSNVKKFMNGGIITTKLETYAATNVKKYNLIMSFNKYSKTLRIKNNLLQSFDPREMPDSDVIKEGKKTKAIKRRFFKLVYIIFNVLPINKNKITFASDSRSELNGNFYFVYEELYKRKLNLKIKFAFNERINQKKSYLQLIKTAFHFATSKIILLDDFYPLVYPLRIRNKADLIQVWHAAGAFKTFGHSRIGRPGGPSPRSRNHKNYTKAVVSSEGVRKNYAEGFGIMEENVYPTGVPRSDVFFDEEYKAYVRDRLHNMYTFLKGKKVILFAPTFRGTGQASAHYPFEMLDFSKLYHELHEEYVFLFKIHPFVKNKLTIPYEYADFFFDLSEYREINDLLLITDILITDYSSVCFEFALLNKPMLFFAFDVESYIEERDFYYDYFNFIPGPLLKTTPEMTDAIKNEAFQLDKVKPFVKYFFADTLGNASANVVDHVIIPSLEDTDREEKEEFVNLTPPASRVELFERSLDNDK